jgi:broad specificity phosphatase PhoE
VESRFPFAMVASMTNLIFITHPEVRIDPLIPVDRWRLSDGGVARMRRFVEGPVVAEVTSIWASTEVKATETAAMLAARLRLGIEVASGLGENDRSATGFLPAAEFEKVADAFFAYPEESVRGWERAIDAQRRIREAVDRIVATHRGGDLAIISHGAVGTLLLCSCLGQAISRKADQPFQGHYWIAGLPSLTVRQSWKPIAPRG